ncbi:MAG: hypothetical protein LWX56_03745 [Ignavibacteria bacterium]|nr:hypothetical protein [Ignavibacteria bacterium]
MKLRALLLLLISMIVVISSSAWAYPGGVSGYTRKNGTTGCSCHGSSYYNTTVLVQITGPDTVQPGQTVNYTVRVSGGPATKAGVDIAASNGTLAPVSTYLQSMSGELTHNASTNYSGTGVDFTFKYTAPAASGTQTLYATGSSKKYWNFASDKQIVIAANNVLNSSISLASGWNLVSVPLVLSNMSAASVFPAASSPVYGFNAGYITASTLTNTAGYWVKMNSASTINVSGQAASPRTIAVTAGWNLIGSLHSSVSVSGITSVPAGIISSAFYKFENGYSPESTTLAPGKGYWVRVSQDGVLTLP